MSKDNLIILLVILFLIGAGCSSVLEEESEPIAVEFEAQEELLEVEEHSTSSSETSILSPGVYLDYSKSAVRSAQEVGNTVVLFFYASWCPYCRSADAQFLAEPDRIPSRVTIFKTDYDSERELKNKYGVKFQDTYVLIDASGEAVDIWTAGGLDELIKRIGN